MICFYLFIFICILNLLTNSETQKYIRGLYRKYFEKLNIVPAILFYLILFSYGILQAIYNAAFVFFFDFWPSKSIGDLQSWLIIILLLGGACIAFFIQYYDDQKGPDITAADLESRPFFPALLWSWGAVAFPVLFVSKLFAIIGKQKKFVVNNMAFSMQEFITFITGSLFAFLAGNLLYVEFYASKAYHNNPGFLLNTFWQRTLMFLICYYLPYKFLASLGRLKEDNKWFIFGSDSLFFFCQISIVYWLAR